MSHPPPSPKPMPGGLLIGNTWSHHMDNEVITSDLQSCIIWHLGYHAAYKYMVTKKQHISPTGFALINYPALTRALTSASPLYQLWYSKFVSGHSTTGHIMCLWGNWVNAQCPFCSITPKHPSMFSSVLILACTSFTALRY